jgi:G3E family GTPase
MTDSEKEFKEALDRLRTHRDNLIKRSDEIMNLPKMDDRGVIIGVKKKIRASSSKE